MRISSINQQLQQRNIVSKNKKINAVSFGHTAAQVKAATENYKRVLDANLQDTIGKFGRDSRENFYTIHGTFAQMLEAVKNFPDDYRAHFPKCDKVIDLIKANTLNYCGFFSDMNTGRTYEHREIARSMRNGTGEVLMGSYCNDYPQKYIPIVKLYRYTPFGGGDFINGFRSLFGEKTYNNAYGYYRLVFEHPENNKKMVIAGIGPESSMVGFYNSQDINCLRKTDSRYAPVMYKLDCDFMCAHYEGTTIDYNVMEK